MSHKLLPWVTFSSTVTDNNILLLPLSLAFAVSFTIALAFAVNIALAVDCCLGRCHSTFPQLTTSPYAHL